jgi:Pyridoxamine 5'-phosphate oxidase
MARQGSLDLLNDPVAKTLLESVNLARLAYTWMDGSPRVVPVWFHWNGDQFVLGSPARAPKLKALAADPRVALTIDDNQWPYEVLLVRGRASVEMLDDVSPEYELAAVRYFGLEQGGAWVSTLRGKPMARIPVTPSWVGILDFQTRFPSALTT